MLYGFSFDDSFCFIRMFKEQTKDTLPEYDLRYGNPIGPEQKIPQTNQLCWARHVANNDNAEVSFKLLDFILSPAGKEFATKYILNNGGEKEWNEWLKTAERLKYKELENIYNAAQKRYNEL